MVEIEWKFSLRVFGGSKTEFGTTVVIGVTEKKSSIALGLFNKEVRLAVLQLVPRGCLNRKR